MKLHYLTLLTASLFVTQAIAEEPSTPTSQPDKLSYSFGQNIGKSLKQQNIELNLELLVKGIQDAVDDQEPLLSQEEMTEVLKNFQKERFARLAKERKESAEKNLQEGEQFLAENKTKEGVVTLPSGLQYKVITPGTGKTPKATDQVTTHYRGTLIDGTEFDSSYKRGKPAVFKVNQVIAGWTEALQLMKEGAKWQLFIPAKLAYGERGAPGGKITPNATLIFDIELISVEESASEESASQSTQEEQTASQPEKESSPSEEQTASQPKVESSSTSAQDTPTENPPSQPQSKPEETTSSTSKTQPDQDK